MPVDRTGGNVRTPLAVVRCPSNGPDSDPVDGERATFAAARCNDVRVVVSFGNLRGCPPGTFFRVVSARCGKTVHCATLCIGRYRVSPHDIRCDSSTRLCEYAERTNTYFQLATGYCSDNDAAHRKRTTRLTGSYAFPFGRRETEVLRRFSNRSHINHYGRCTQTRFNQYFFFRGGGGAWIAIIIPQRIRHHQFPFFAVYIFQQHLRGTTNRLVALICIYQFAV